MAYLAFYRTFRPSSFDTVVRQEHVVRILKNQISSGKVGHAYLFCGPRGTGKTTLAKIFARAINCENPQNASPCGVCPTCRALAEGSSLDVSEIDAASNNGVDEMRDLREKVQYPPVVGKYKVYIIDEVHMLTPSAFNAVLKTLEEPPRHAVFILATTEPQKIPATILSRCMRFDFKLIPQKDLEQLIKTVLQKTGKEYEDAAVSAIARAGAGSARDSLSIADMCASYSEGKLTYDDVSAVLGSADVAKIARLCGYIMDEDAQNALTDVENILSTGKSVGVLIKDMLSFLNNLAIVKVCRNAREIINLPDETYDSIEAIARRCDGHKLLRVTEILAAAETDMRYSSSGRITLETAVLKCSMPQEDYNLDALIGKINSLEQKLKSGQYAVAAQPVPQTEPVEKSKPAPEPNAEQPAGKAEKKLVVEPDEDEPPFERGDEIFSATPSAPQAEEKPKSTTAEQPSLWDDVQSVAPRGGSLSEGDKRTLFAKFLKSLRTTHKNAVLFTLCMDLDNTFEGEKFILITESEPMFKALNRADNYKFIGEVLLEFGVSQYEIRLRPKGENAFDKAMKELTDNFDGIDIEIK